MDAQRERIRAYCKGSGFKLVHLAEDDTSAKSLDRPGLAGALKLLEQGKADALLVVKLDRLTRSVIDLGTLLHGYFLKEQHHLLSVTESLDTRNAMGRFVLYILALIAQWEREAISERVRDAMRHLKAQGCFVGRPPYGFRVAALRGPDGRSYLEPVPEEQQTIERIIAMVRSGIEQEELCAALHADGIPAPRGDRWNRTMIFRVLKRAGVIPERTREYKPRKHINILRDKKLARAAAKQLRAEGLSLRAVAERLLDEGLYPPRGGRWHAASVSELLSVKDAKDAVARARQLRAEGHSLREVGRRLLYEGFMPANGGAWSVMVLAGMTAPSQERAGDAEESEL